MPNGDRPFASWRRTDGCRQPDLEPLVPNVGVPHDVLVCLKVVQPVQGPSHVRELPDDVQRVPLRKEHRLPAVRIVHRRLLPAAAGAARFDVCHSRSVDVERSSSALFKARGGAISIAMPIPARDEGSFEDRSTFDSFDSGKIKVFSIYYLRFEDSIVHARCVHGGAHTGAAIGRSGRHARRARSTAVLVV